MSVYFSLVDDLNPFTATGRLGYPLISIYSNRESPGNPREFPKIKEKRCIMQGTIPRIVIMQLKQVLVFDIILNVLSNKKKNILETYH